MNQGFRYTGPLFCCFVIFPLWRDTAYGRGWEGQKVQPAVKQTGHLVSDMEASTDAASLRCWKNSMPILGQTTTMNSLLTTGVWAFSSLFEYEWEVFQ